VNKVVSKNGGFLAVARTCPLLEKGRGALWCKGRSFRCPSRRKSASVVRSRRFNATTTARLLEDCACRPIAVAWPGPREQGYSGAANWDVISEVAASVARAGDRQRRTSRRGRCRSAG